MIMENTITKRPEWDNDSLNELADFTAKILFDWCSGKTDLKDCKESTEKVLKWHSNDDGYELAKQFENDGFCSDRGLVDALDIVSYERSRIVDRNVVKWASENKLVLDLIIGDKVKFIDSRNKEKTGEINKLIHNRYCYGIWSEDLGYPIENGGLIVAAEKVSLIE